MFRQGVSVSTCVFDLWSWSHVSSVWIQLGCQEADKVSVVSRATGSDQLQASGAVRELCLYLFPTTDGPVCLNHAVHYLLCLFQVMPAVLQNTYCKWSIVARFVIPGFFFFLNYHVCMSSLVWTVHHLPHRGKLQQLYCYWFSSRKILIQCFISALLARSSVSL